MSLILRLACGFVIAFGIGKLVSKIKLPSILGWLLAGMILGPHAVGLLNETLLENQLYEKMISIMECAVGLMIGTELVWKRIRSMGKQIIVTTLTQSIGTFLFVSLVFGVLFYVMDIPVFLSVIFGGIALATAPAPALSIVREFKTDGPVTKTLIPMAALDDMVAVVVFFTVISTISGGLSEQAMPFYMIILVVLLPVIIGVAAGIPAGLLLRKKRSAVCTCLMVSGLIVAVSVVGMAANYILFAKPVLNFMLIGMSFSAAFANVVSEERLEEIMHDFNPLLGFAMILVILNLGSPLDYHLIMGAGLFTAVYIISRAMGKCGGAYIGAKATDSPETVKHFLGLVLLPHSGVSLVFTGIAVSTLSGPAPECAQIIQGTIAAAAVINEIIAVIVAKKAFELAGELKPDSQNMGIEDFHVSNEP